MLWGQKRGNDWSFFKYKTISTSYIARQSKPLELINISVTLTLSSNPKLFIFCLYLLYNI